MLIVKMEIEGVGKGFTNNVSNQLRGYKRRGLELFYNNNIKY